VLQVSYLVDQLMVGSGLSDWVGIKGILLGGRDIGVVSMVLMLGWGGGAAWVLGVSLTSYRPTSGLLLSAEFFFPPGYVCVC